MKKLRHPTRWLRYSVLATILTLIFYVAFGYGKRSFEAFCPFGGMESLWGLYQSGEFSCTLGPLNLSLLIGVLVLALIARKAFCGWACPIGFLSELASRFTSLFWRRRPQPSEKAEKGLKLLRYVVLVAALYFTYKSEELILRGYDPFFLLFSGFGHGSLGIVSWIVFAALVVGAFLIPMFFCRYLCPMGATFDPFSKVGMLKVVRNESSCTMCGACQRKCPQNLAPQSVVKLRHQDCTLCLECLDACPIDKTLELRAMI
ncbi:MAG: 4Fe-4S binding protein [bacterium]|nr:4Fe-4S binding protein [bacterium]